MRKFFKQATSVALAAAMVFTLAPVASAADTVTVNPDLQIEGYVDKHVYNVTLPTIPEGTDVKTGFEFVADPQGLLNIADKDTYAEGPGAIYFKTKDEVEADDAATPAVTASPAEYGMESRPITIINNSSFDVNVGLNIDVNTEDSGITLTDEDAIENATEPSLYLALVKKGATTADDVVTPISTTKTADETLAKIGAVEYEADGTTVKTPGYKVFAMTDAVYTDPATTDADKAGYSSKVSPQGWHYKYDLSEDYDPEVNGSKLSYALTGRCDTKTDWSKVSTDLVNINMVWTITDPDASTGPDDKTDTYKILLYPDGTASYKFVTKPNTTPTGITALAADATDRMGAVNAGNVSYDAATGILSFNATAVTNFIANATEVTATINGEDFTFTLGEAEIIKDDYNIVVAADGTASYTFVTKPSTNSTGLTALAADGTDRMAAANAGNVTYDAASGVLSFKAPAVTNFISKASQVTATINGENFTFTVEDPYVITISGTGDSATASLVFNSSSKPTGNITALKINGTDDRMAAVTAGNVTYNATTGTLSFKAPAVNNFLSAATSVNITIGTSSYSLRLTK